MDENKYTYLYPVEELDAIIEQMNQGIMPMMTDQMQTEIQLRLKEIQGQLFDDDEDVSEMDAETIKRHREMLDKHLEEQKRKASRDDVLIIKISDDQKKSIKEEMSTSIVRPNPNNAYNISDDDNNHSAKHKMIYQKLASLQNVYYHQEDYRNAINIIKEAIEYSLETDYPWLSKEEAIKEFNEGRIKFTYMNIPAFKVGYTTLVSDPEILKGIVTGDVVLKDNKDEAPAKKVGKNNYNPIDFDYDIINSDDFKQMLEAHRRGYDTPASTFIKSKSTKYNRYAIPQGNMFAKQNVDKNGVPMLWDWEREGAGDEYFRMINGIQYKTSDLIKDLNSDNGGRLGTQFATNVNNFLRSMKFCNTPYNNSGGYDYTPTQPLQVNPEAERIERELLNSIKINNPTR